jgi:hypothetical protein
MLKENERSKNKTLKNSGKFGEKISFTLIYEAPT